MKVKDDFEVTDHRKFELQFSQGVLFTNFTLKLTQLELLKIYKVLVATKRKQLSLKFRKFIEAIDDETGLRTDFDRNLPHKTNGRRISEWEDIRNV